MTPNLGEEIVAAYLQYIKHCEFIQQNLYTPDVQGEIDVVGIDLETKTIYVCNVGIRLSYKTHADRRILLLNSHREQWIIVAQGICPPHPSNGVVCF